MKLIEEHIQKHLYTFIQDTSDLFETVFNELKSENKQEYKDFLKYVYCILEKIIGNEDDLNVLNIHFEKILSDDEKTLTAEFLWRCFFEKQLLNESTHVDNEVLKEKKNNLKKSIDKAIIYNDPSSAITSYEKREIIKKNKEKKEKKEIDKLNFKFYEKLKNTASLIPSTIFNLKAIQEKLLKDLFEHNPTYLSVDELGDLNSYVVYNINSFNDVKKIRLNNEPLLKIVENIILFDCENSVKRFSEFNFQQLSNLNQNHGTKFKSFISITFSKKVSLNSMTSQINRLNTSYFIPMKKNYVISNFESDILIEDNQRKTPDLIFIEPLNCTFWEDFIIETKINGLYELRSIKLKNIYNLCFNEEIKGFILNDVFSPEIRSSILKDDTKDELLSLPSPDIENIKTLLTNVLDMIIESNLKAEIKVALENNPKIVIDDFIKANYGLFSKVKSALGYNQNRNYKCWEDIEDEVPQNAIILSYRDQGPIFNNFYPNINELYIYEDKNIKCFYIEFLYKQTYEWSQYNLLKDYYKLFNHQIRNKYFSWEELNNEIKKLKPEKRIEIDWDLESDYSNTENRITYTLFYENPRGRLTCNPSDLIIYFEKESNQKRVQTIKWIYENIGFNDVELFVQELDELIEKFNPAEKIIDTQQQDRELEIIRKQFDLGNESTGRLWKVLLLRKVVESNIDSIYQELKNVFITKNINIVSKNHFENVWIKPESDSLLPRGNKEFKILCDYLNLPTSYRRIIYTIKNRTIKGRRNATRMYSKLLKDLFNDGCFDDGVLVENILSNRIQYYKNSHNLDELGIDEENPLNDLVALDELIKPELSLKKVEKIEKHEQNT